MIKHIWSVLCEDSTIDQETNKLSIRNIIETIEVRSNAPKPFPDKIIVPINFEIVSYLTRSDSNDEERIPFKAELLNAEMDKISEFQTKIVFPKNSNKLRSRAKVNGILIRGEGKYVFMIYLEIEKDKKPELVAELPLEIKFLK